VKHISLEGSIFFEMQVKDIIILKKGQPNQYILTAQGVIVAGLWEGGERFLVSRRAGNNPATRHWRELRTSFFKVPKTNIASSLLRNAR